MKFLDYEGNEIEYLPGSMLSMKKMEYINVKNNYLHPLIWRKHTYNKIPVSKRIIINGKVLGFITLYIQYLTFRVYFQLLLHE